MTLIKLFFIFFYIGAFAVGGGLVASTFMQQILVLKYGLITQEKFFAMLAISEGTPGPIGINMATYIGNELFGPWGGIVCTLGEVLPSLIVLVIICRFFFNFKDTPLVQSMFSTLRPATSGMIMVAISQVWQISVLTINNFKESGYQFVQLFNWPSLAFFAVCIVFLFKTKIHPIFFVIAGGIFGVLFL